MNTSCSTPNLQEERCDGCGLCAQVCSRGVLVVDLRRLHLHPERDCDGCGTCEEVCPQDALDYPFEIVWADEEKPQSAAGGEPSA